MQTKYELWNSFNKNRRHWTNRKLPETASFERPLPLIVLQDRQQNSPHYWNLLIHCDLTSKTSIEDLLLNTSQAVQVIHFKKNVDEKCIKTYSIKTIQKLFQAALTLMSITLI